MLIYHVDSHVSWLLVYWSLNIDYLDDPESSEVFQNHHLRRTEEERKGEKADIPCNDGTYWQHLRSERINDHD